MVITLAALNSGVLDLNSAAALVIGADLGTTLTVVIGGLGGSVAKKQVALGQFLFNLTTDIIALVLLAPLLEGVLMVVGRYAARASPEWPCGLMDKAAPVAQWIWRLPPEQKAVGSSPAGRATLG